MILPGDRYGSFDNILTIWKEKIKIALIKLHHMDCLNIYFVHKILIEM